MRMALIQGMENANKTGVRFKGTLMEGFWRVWVRLNGRALFIEGRSVLLNRDPAPKGGASSLPRAPSFFAES